MPIITASSTSGTFTTPADAYFARFCEKNDNFGSAQLELGSQASDYQPYQGQEFEVNLGKNLLPNNMTSQTLNGVTFTVNADKSITMSGTATARSEPRIYYVSASDSVLKLKAGTTYYNNMQTTLYLYTTTYRVIYAGASYTPTADETVTQAYIRIENGETVDTAIYPMLTAGAPSATYAPYFTPIELAKIGDYQDRIYKDGSKWYIEKQVGKVVWNGSEIFSTYPYGTNSYVTTINGSANTPIGTALLKSDHFIGVAYTDRTQSIDNMIYADAGVSGQIDIRNTTWTSATDFKTWLSTHPTTVYYALATPTDTEITDETLLAQLNFIASLYGGVNNIMLIPTSGAQGTMEVNYYADVDTTGAGYEWEAGEGGGPTIVQVIGVDNAQPIWTVTGPATNPTLTNITTVQTITWNGTVPNGQKLIVDMANQTATLAGANVYEFITGSWITLRPGANKLTYSAQGADQASQIQWNGVVG